MFHRETIRQKQMVLPENQFNCEQVQWVKYTKIHRNQFIQKKLIIKKCALKTLLKCNHAKFWKKY